MVVPAPCASTIVVAPEPSSRAERRGATGPGHVERTRAGRRRRPSPACGADHQRAGQQRADPNGERGALQRRFRLRRASSRRMRRCRRVGSRSSGTERERQTGRSRRRLRTVRRVEQYRTEREHQAADRAVHRGRRAGVRESRWCRRRWRCERRRRGCRGRCRRVLDDHGARDAGRLHDGVRDGARLGERELEPLPLRELTGVEARVDGEDGSRRAGLVDPDDGVARLHLDHRRFDAGGGDAHGHRVGARRRAPPARGRAEPRSSARRTRRTRQSARSSRSAPGTPAA